MTTDGIVSSADQSMTTALDSTIFTKLTKNKLHCTVCDKIVSTRSCENHIRMHTVIQPYSCPICDKKFAHRSSVNRHKKSHDKTQLFQCSVCDKGFTSKCTFDIHLELHKNSGSCFPCNMCEKVFPSGSQLVDHMALHGQLQYIQIADASGKSDIRLAPGCVTLIPDNAKTSELLISTGALETRDSNELSHAVVTTTLPGSIPMEEAGSCHKPDSDGVIYQETDTQPYQILNSKDTVPIQLNSNSFQGSKLYLLSESRERERDEHRRSDTVETSRRTESFGALDRTDDSHPDGYHNETHLESHSSARINHNQTEISVGDECILRKMLASKIVGSVNALSAKRALVSTAGRSYLESEAGRKYADELLTTGAYSKYTDRLTTSAACSNEVEEIKSRQHASQEVTPPPPPPPAPPQEITSILEGIYTTGADGSKLQSEVTYLNNIDLRNKIPQIRYFVNLRKPNIMYATKQQDVSANSKDYLHDIQSAHILQNVHDLQNATFFQNAHFLQNAHILQNAHALVCVDTPIIERRFMTETGEANDNPVTTTDKVNSLEKLDPRHVYRFTDTPTSDIVKTNDTPHTREAILYGETAPVTTSHTEPPPAIPEEKREGVSTETLVDTEPRREPVPYSELPPKTSSTETLEPEDPYSFTLSVSSRDGTAFGDVANVDSNSQDGVLSDAGAVAVHTVPAPKRSRRSGSSSSKRSRSDSGYKSFKCTSCDRYFPCSSALDRHRQSKHPPHVVCHTCAICGKALYHPSHIYIHMRTHV